MPEQSTPVYWINLEHSTKRRDRMERWLSKTGWSTHRISAVDGTSVSQVSDSIRTRAGTMPKDAACIASHLLAIQTAYESGADTALILEDDVRPASLPVPQAPLALAPDCPAGFGLVQLCVLQDPVRLDWLYRKTESYLPIGRRCWWSLGAYLIARPAMQQLLTLYTTKNGGFDVTGFQGPMEAYFVVAHTLASSDSSAILMRNAPMTTEADDSEIHPSDLPRHRTALQFAQEYRQQLSANQYQSPFPLWRRVWEDIRF